MNEKILNISSDILNKYNLLPCKEQISAGGERPCCGLKHLINNNDPKFAKKIMKPIVEGGTSTFCVPGTMGKYCFGEED